MTRKPPTSFVLGCLCSAALLSFATQTPAHASAQRRGQRTTQKHSGPKPDAQDKATPAQGKAAHSVTIRWKGQPGVERYRLQVARDKNFDDVVFDQAVNGREHVVELPPGPYFWRIAPAVSETGRYSEAQAVEIDPATKLVEERAVVTASGAGGWRTATGEMPRPVAVRLRAGGAGYDLVGVNTDGNVYAIDGRDGIALWTARYNPAARRGEEAANPPVLFSPLALPSGEGRSHVVAAFDGGLRALGGETGREVWRAQLQGRAAAGVVADLDGDGKPEVLAVLTSPDSLVVLSGETGRVISNPRLSARAVGAPTALVSGAERSVVVALADGTVESWRAGGERSQSFNVECGVTTGPLVVSTPRGQIVVVGCEKGLMALQDTDLRALGRIDTGQDAPRGTLTAADVDGDNVTEVLMVTRGGRVALIGTTDGRIRWVAEGAQDADAVTLADLDGDGVLDVLAPAGRAFASGFSGRDGALIWRVEEDARRGAAAATAAAEKSRPRALVVTQPGTGQTYLVGGDPSRTGLRAVELPKGAARTAER